MKINCTKNPELDCNVLDKALLEYSGNRMPYVFMSNKTFYALFEDLEVGYWDNDIIKEREARLSPLFYGGSKVFIDDSYYFGEVEIR